ncbi:MAG: UDP-N-acetylmuramoyl-L-alanine--D-glutamate ligase, partial [Rubrobacteridae bacterium]|nr:UDP-N-acetylmuramoyl-L-alanine--D-glutamate ligase [Rubrobacteridae bacterium]
MNFKGIRVLVLGLGRSGRAATAMLSKLGSHVVCSDSSSSDEMLLVAEELRKAGIIVELGPQKEDLLNEVDLIVVSPGVPSSSQIVKTARSRGMAVWSEIELAYSLTDKTIVAITGTNGKTTTTTLIGEIFKAAGRSAAVVGNIGVPLIEAAADPSIDTLIVEVSSFQLETIDKFRPHVAVLLNITEDHLDWHPDFDDYIRSKKRIFMNQTDADFAVLNLDDSVVGEISKDIKSRLIATSKSEGTSAGVFIRGNRIMARSGLMAKSINGDQFTD